MKRLKMKPYNGIVTRPFLQGSCSSFLSLEPQASVKPSSLSGDRPARSRGLDAWGFTELEVEGGRDDKEVHSSSLS